MAQNIFRGLGIALITPFKTDGSVDYQALKRLVEFQIDNGADSFASLLQLVRHLVLLKMRKIKSQNLSKRSIMDVSRF